MSNHKIRTEDSTASGGYEARVFETHSTVRVDREQTKVISTGTSSASGNPGPQSLGAATVPSSNKTISVVVNVDPTNARGRLREANRVLSGEPARKTPEPESR